MSLLDKAMGMEIGRGREIIKEALIQPLILYQELEYDFTQLHT